MESKASNHGAIKAPSNVPQTPSTVLEMYQTHGGMQGPTQKSAYEIHDCGPGTSTGFNQFEKSGTEGSVKGTFQK